VNLVRLDPAPVVEAFGVLTPHGSDARHVARAAETGVGAPPGVDLTLATGFPRGSRRLGRYEALGLAAAHLALSQAEVVPPDATGRDWGVILGSSTGSWASNAEYFHALDPCAGVARSPALFARTVCNAVNGEISIAHRIGGANHMFVSGWSAGGDALVEAAALLEEGRASRILAGGVEAPDAAVQRMHARSCRDPGLEWLPERISEAACVCLLARDLPRADPTRIVIRAYARGRDPSESWSPGALLETFPEGTARTIVVANTVPPRLLARWKAEAGDACFLDLSRGGELGAAGVPVAVAVAAVASRGAGGVLVVGRSIEGGMVLLLLGSPAAG
jgi:hypothetical protein